MDDFIVFIPNKLEVGGRPELSGFPLNVLLYDKKIVKSVIADATSLYVPDFSTFLVQGSKKQMDYKSTNDPRYKLVISFDVSTGNRTCDKYCNDKVIGKAFGGEDWQKFFIQVGLLRLKDGEKCDLGEDTTSLDALNKWASLLTIEQIENLSDEEVLSKVIERPDHPGQYGFMLQQSYFKSDENFTEISYALLKRLNKIGNIKERITQQCQLKL